jgi:dienelactone hydrolase
MRTTKIVLLGCMIAGTLAFAACGDQSGKTDETTDNKSDTPAIKEEAVTYTADSATLNGFVAYDANKAGKRPVVLVVPEWWGVNDYVRSRAKQLAELGYLAIAVDMYGNGKIAANPDEAGKLSGQFYQNPALAKARFDAALNKIMSYPQADTANIAAIGYCFGGSVVLNVAKMGENLNGVVSFHGGLQPIVPASKELLKAKILVCHGNADSFVPADQVNQFKKQMDSIGADYTFKSYDSATHAFTNPQATAVGKQFKLPIAYNAEADKASWNDMKAFFDRIFK